MDIRSNRLKGSVVVLTLASAAVISAQEPGRPEVRTFAFRAPIELRLVKGAPYSAETTSESVQTLVDGNRIVQRFTGRVYRDSEGRVRREEDRGSGSPTISITDPVANVSYSLDPDTRTAWQTPTPAGLGVAGVFRARVGSLQAHFENFPPNPDPQPLPDPFLGAVPPPLKGDLLTLLDPGRRGDLSGEQRSESLPPRLIEGVQAQGVRRTTTIPAGVIGNEQPIVVVAEEWFSPDLQTLVLTERSDPRVGTSTYRVINIVRIEPDRSLFEVPSDYTIQKSDFIRKALPPRRER
jgi:hypothetical protein